MTRTAVYKPRGSHPLAQVTCNGCGRVFVSGARTHTTCPGCGKDLRVHRSARVRKPAAATGRQQRAPVPPPAAVRRPPVPVRQEPGIPPPRPEPLAPRLAAAPLPDDDEPYSYVMLDGRLVLAEQRDDYVVPAAALPAEWLAGELRARGWKLRPHGQGTCEVVTYPDRWPTPDLQGECPAAAVHREPRVCGWHFDVLRSPYISRRSRR